MLHDIAYYRKYSRQVAAWLYGQRFVTSPRAEIIPIIDFMDKFSLMQPVGGGYCVPARLMGKYSAWIESVDDHKKLSRVTRFPGEDITAGSFCWSRHKARHPVVRTTFPVSVDPETEQRMADFGARYGFEFEIGTEPSHIAGRIFVAWWAKGTDWRTPPMRAGKRLDARWVLA